LGDEGGFADLVDGLHCRLLAVAGTFTYSPVLAEDIVQDPPCRVYLEQLDLTRTAMRLLPLNEDSVAKIRWTFRK
jgi:hypothetical protein